ncbi:CHASE2 domain-containing serine/threonine-protein kinase [Rhodoferax sp.]|uniref:CHASE2 domain-containing serine/threonine-protein kinase n=1 Tax=Rhodoferax sp. TaxID=50421 RepID=UPI002727FE9C|nr:serine/threonine-protein kinase [Rhodoferax sp.]MDO9199026.1 serine/threonine-protein kinase [Rhodoferax sp.]
MTVLHLATDFFGALERRLYDVASTIVSPQPSGQLAVIAIDEQSIARLGPWPWSLDIHARLIDQLAAAKAHTIVHTVYFPEPQLDRGLGFIRRVKEVLAASTDATSPPSAAQEQLARVIAEAEAALDTDGQLVASIKSAGNVIIPSHFTPGQQPTEGLETAAAGVGHLSWRPDGDGIVRQEALLVNHDGKAMPSLALLAAVRSLDATPADIRLREGDSVQIGKLRVPTDGDARMRPGFYKGRSGNPAFALDSFEDVLSGKIPAARYAGKTVVIGVTAAGLVTQFAVPGNPALSPAEAVAHITSSLLSGHFIVQPAWGNWATLGAFLLVCGYVIALLPRLSTGAAALFTVLFFIGLLGAEFGLLAGAALWLKMVLPAAVLVIAHLALTSRRLLSRQRREPESEQASAQTSRMMGLALQGQGQLDLAFDRFRRVPMDDAVMGDLYGLAVDFERQRQFNKADAVYEHMAAHDGSYKDLKAKVARSQRLPSAASLGRYQIEKEIGKGAMGVVYLGKDPKIGRVVAIKTMALGQEFDGAALVDARERFFREAETAGRLQHQNIVTIFDAGEEHDLAYIAMEFIKGGDLVNSCKDGRLLPVPTVLSIVARVAQALAYAHRHNVVHRDIKPANIMYESGSDTVKVTDFGIARITDSSKTRTGLVLGTPSFMSPEQLAGNKVDGRSDLYSLGVTLFQLLAGVLPFRGDSMAELMDKIVKQDAPDIRIIRKDLPEGLAKLVAVLLRKRPEARYQDGDQLARDLRAVLSGGNPIDLEPQPETP